jgi:hypothetical protein
MAKKLKNEAWRNALENWIVNNNAKVLRTPLSCWGGGEATSAAELERKYSLYGKQQQPHSLVRNAQLGKP